MTDPNRALYEAMQALATANGIRLPADREPYLDEAKARLADVIQGIEEGVCPTVICTKAKALISDRRAAHFAVAREEW